MSFPEGGPWANPNPAYQEGGSDPTPLAPPMPPLPPAESGVAPAPEDQVLPAADAQPVTPTPEAHTAPETLNLHLILSGEVEDPSKISDFKKALARTALQLAMQHGITPTEYRIDDAPLQSTDETAPTDEPAQPEKPQPTAEPLFSPEVQDKLDVELSDLLGRTTFEPYSGAERESLSDKVKAAFGEAFAEADITSVRDVAILGTDRLKAVLPQRVGIRSTERGIDGFLGQVRSAIPEPVVDVRKKFAEEGATTIEALQGPLYTVEQIATFCNDPNQLSLDVVALATNESLPAIPAGWEGYGLGVFVEDGQDIDGLLSACNYELTEDAVKHWVSEAGKLLNAFRTIHPAPNQTQG
ncbi:MAG TPA: hypothetical protein VFI74_02570 [Candidatus Saccharimonadales bacterium]|nr:hypothetical protein [Candidatus Saccharimonadales bacterium]